MNSLVEFLNGYGQRAAQFAWPMLWQSSVLIALLFTFDFLLRRRMRPALRYACWLLVLVKLVLPPALAFPTSLGWWLRSRAPARTMPQIRPLVVTYGPIRSQPAPPISLIKPAPKTPLSVAAASLLLSFAANSCLLLLLLLRWRQVARVTRNAAPAPAWLDGLLEEKPAKLCVRTTSQPLSPAVCGLFRPVILIPHSMVERLSPTQLRAILLHELIHLRRGDLWVNWAQTILQLLYWWHPLLWLANARIRALREEAVDDAVMVALRHEADSYAPTLLQVAKLALHRPLATLGLVGILESHSGLRRRIERLLDFRPPARSGLTLASALTVAALGAVALHNCPGIST
jgi:beta-lactamase regulating signal transducer with metallopeptidase domain